MRFLARESRTRRRMLGMALKEILTRTPSQMRFLRVVAPSNPGDPHYVFLLFPMSPKHSYEENRNVRRNFLEACCRVVKMKFPEALDIVGIATESGVANPGRSEDAVYLDTRHWTEANDEKARELQKELGILVNPTQTSGTEPEYPDVNHNQSIAELSKNPRNKPCPCGSGKKYKKCHGRY